MLQPFERFQESYVDRLIQLKKFYLVTQTYRRGNGAYGEILKNDILLTDYEDPDEARTHLDKVKDDRYAAIIDLSKAEHKRTLLDMLQAESRYHVYWAIIRSKKSLEDWLNRKYENNMRRYINTETNLRPSNGTVIKPELTVIHGELYVLLKHRSHHLKIKFEDIENT